MDHVRYSDADEGHKQRTTGLVLVPLTHAAGDKVTDLK